MKNKILHHALFSSTLARGYWPVAVTIGLLFTGAAQATMDIDCSIIGDSVDMIAGQKYDTGEVSCQFENPGEVTVTYTTEGGPWCMTQTHLAVANSLADIPTTNKGSPKLGKFPYGDSYEPCKIEVNIPVPLPSDCDVIGDGDGDEFIFAAHAVVVKNYPGPNSDPTYCPQGDISLNYPGTESYFETTVFNDAGYNGGPYKGWCVDVFTYINPSINHHCKFYNTIEDLEEILNLAESEYGILIQKPENLDMVNWLINEDIVGEVYENDPVANPTPSWCDTLPPAGATFRWADEQVAIWGLVNTLGDQGGGVPDVDLCRAEELYRRAFAYGDNFEPNSEEKVAILCENVDEDCNRLDRQPVIFEFPNQFDTESETAWGMGDNRFTDNDWGTYIKASCPAD